MKNFMKKMFAVMMLLTITLTQVENIPNNADDSQGHGVQTFISPNEDMLEK